MSAKKTIKVKLTKSLISRLASHKACARGLGLTKINQVREVIDTPENRGITVPRVETFSPRVETHRYSF